MLVRIMVKLYLTVTRRYAYRRVQQSSESQKCTGGSHRHKHNATKQHQSVPTFFMINRRAPERPLKTLPTPSHDASGRPQRLPSCERLVAASQAARGAFLSPPPPLLLLLLLLGCCRRRPLETPERAHARPPPPALTATPAAAPACTLRPSPPLLPPPWQPLWRPQRSIQLLHEACRVGTQRGQKRGPEVRRRTNRQPESRRPGSGS